MGLTVKQFCTPDGVAKVVPNSFLSRAKLHKHWFEWSVICGKTQFMNACIEGPKYVVKSQQDQ